MRAPLGPRRPCVSCGKMHRRQASEKCEACEPRVRPGGARKMRERRRLELEALGRVQVWRSLDIRDPEQLVDAINETAGKAMTLQAELWEMLHEVPREQWRYTDDKGAEQVRTELKMAAEQSERTAKILLDATGKRLEAARVAIQAKQVEILQRAVLMVLEDRDLGLTTAQKRLFRQRAAEQLLSLNPLNDVRRATADGDTG